MSDEDEAFERDMREADAAYRRAHKIFDLDDTCSFDDFDRNRSECLERLRESGWPLVLTHGSDSAYVIQSASEYRDLLRRLDAAECTVAILQAREAIAKGDTLPLDEAFEQIRNGTWRDKPPVSDRSSSKHM